MPPPRSSPTSSESECTERPRKRQRVTSRPTSSICRQLILEEVDLEIALQERLVTAAQSRISWALLLQQALQNDLSATGLSSIGFQDAALDALAAVEAPCDILFTREVQPIARFSAPPTPSATTPSEPPQTPITYSTRQRGPHRTARPPARKLLFLRNTAKFPPQIVKLACPDCHRTDFSSLQGLLNHCRLGHKREFGSHDDCVQSCAVLVEGAEDQAWVVANGTEVGGVSLPGLRRLFELAVGGGMELLTTPIPATPKEEHAAEIVQLAASQESQSTPQPAEEAVPHVTRTLGYHVDSPTLAPFLGRVPTKRRINVYNEDQVIDIFSASKPGPTRAVWRMSYTHRNKARVALDEVVEPPPPVATPPLERPSATEEIQSSIGPSLGSGSRFRIAARVSIQDISRWITPGRRSDSMPEEHTHQWRLAVTSPTYSLAISSFLRKLTITCLTDPPPSTMTEALTIDAAPFIVTSTSDKPFLARLTFTWAGTNEQNPPMEVDHWVELDPFRLSNPVLGDEQFFDVELDRHTELLAGDENPQPVPDVWDFSSTEKGANDTNKEETKTTGEELIDPEYVLKLKSLLPQVPMTLKDVKGRLPKQLPYSLVSTPAQFRSLPYGRRKALEWARARTLRELYDQLCASENTETGHANLPLTNIDVLRWLEDEGLFPRSATTQPAALTKSGRAKRKQLTVKNEEGVPDSEFHCRYCGLHFQYHPSAATVSEATVPSPAIDADGVKLEPTAATIPPAAVSSTCITFNERSTEISPIDVNRLINLPAGNGDVHGGYMDRPLSTSVLGDISPHELVTAADPKLITAMQELCGKWRLETFSSTSGPSNPVDLPAPLQALTRSKDEIERDLSPFALLSLLTRSLTRTLIRGGVEEYHRDEAGVRAMGLKHRTRKHIQPRRLLTPSHIVRGLIHDAPRSSTSVSLLSIIAPLGISLPNLPEDVPVTGMKPEDP